MPHLFTGPVYYRREWLDNTWHLMQDSDTLCDTGLTADSFGDKWVLDGTILDRIVDLSSDTGKLCVRATGSTYTAVGILLTENVNLRYGDVVVAYVTHGRARENLVICEGVAGSISDTVKAYLDEVQWT